MEMLENKDIKIYVFLNERVVVIMIEIRGEFYYC